MKILLIHVIRFAAIYAIAEFCITVWGPFGILVYAIACAPFIMLAAYLVVQYLWSAQ